jgi:hypothetical protein
MMFFEIDLKPALADLPAKGAGAAQRNTKPDEQVRQQARSPWSSSLGVGSQLVPKLEVRREAPPQEPPRPPQEADKPLLVPKKSEIVMNLMSFITTRTAAPGDKFYGQVAIPVIVDNQIIVPVNAYVVGSVQQSHRAGRIRGKSELMLNFNSIILPSGETRNIEARIQSADGYKSEDIQKSEGTIKAESQKGKDLEEGARNAGTGAILGSIIVGGSARSLSGVSYGGIGGAAAGLGLTLLKRGADVELQKGTQITLVLAQDVSLAKTR